MSELKRLDDPSMEEILASIRRIIAEDSETVVHVGGMNGANDAGTIRQDILELTDRIEADGSVVSISSRKPWAPVETPGAEAREADDPAAEIAKDEPTKPEYGKDRLISEAAAAAASASLAQLAKEAPRVSKLEPAAPAPEKAVEDMTREMMKPLLKSWLDGNLPQIIERVVKEEIARLSREAQQH
jgi:cell pole-organizing protein PopZ